MLAKTQKTISEIKPLFNFIKKTSRPILRNVCVGNGKLYATDLDTWIQLNYASGLSEGLHHVDTLGLFPGRMEEMLDYPEMLLDRTTLDSTAIKLQDLIELYDCTSSDETRVNLNGIGFINDHAYSCDGHRAKWSPLGTTLKHEHNESYIFHNDGIETLIKLMKKFKVKDIKINFNDMYAWVETTDFLFLSRLVSREFPRIANIIPTKYKSEFTVKSWIDFRAVKPVLNARSLSCIITVLDGLVTFQDKEKKLPATVIGDAPLDAKIEMGFNAKYLNDAIGKNKNVVFRFNSELSPVGFEHEYSGLVMPMKL